MPRTFSSTLSVGGVAAAIMIALTSATSVVAHPHDILAQCQLQNGKWVMCDETIHDPSSGVHVHTNAPAANTLAAPPQRERPRARPATRLKQGN